MSDAHLAFPAIRCRAVTHVFKLPGNARRVAVDNLDLEVPAGGVFGFLGANGAGKTTLLDTICGVLPAQSGSIKFADREVAGCAPERLVQMGMSHVPQGRQLFPDMTVHENLVLGAYRRTRSDKRTQMREDIDRIHAIFPILAERHEQMAGTLSGGEQQMLAVGRALMSRPKLMMMDEPSLGLAPLIVRDIFSIIREINKRGVTILLIEQNANMALSTAHTGYVLETGRITMTGPGKELLANDAVKAAYLGT